MGDVLDYIDVFSAGADTEADERCQREPNAPDGDAGPPAASLHVAARGSLVVSRFVLLHRHALRQIARLVHVTALADRHVVGKKLHGDGQQDWCE